MIKNFKIVLSVLSAVVFVGSFSPAWVLAAGPIRAFVSILPQKYFVEQIGKDLVDVRAMVQPGASPATYEPKPKQLVGLSKARIYFSMGVPFEKVWLKKIASANPQMKVVHTDHGIKKIPMASHGNYVEGKHHEKAEQQEQHGDHHDQVILDPHIWLSPPLVKMQARTILFALQQVDPSHGTVYKTNYHQFVSRIHKLDGQLKTMFAGKQGLQFMVFHPAWGYFARAYGIEQVSIEIEGKDPKPAQLKELIEHARENHIKVIFVQPQFSTKSADLVAKSIGGQVAFADPLAEDWLANLREIADKFKAVLK
ncbi:MAG: zinc ABC transporter substrate-binding protein [Desulfobacterales bacterium]|jgi:zinc transport system substrate-binding protein